MQFNNFRSKRSLISFCQSAIQLTLKLPAAVADVGVGDSISPMVTSCPSFIVFGRRLFRLVLLSCLVAALYLPVTAQIKIDRKALVERHKVVNVKADTLSSLSVGNGKFAFTV